MHPALRTSSSTSLRRLPLSNFFRPAFRTSNFREVHIIFRIKQTYTRDSLTGDPRPPSNRLFAFNSLPPHYEVGAAWINSFLTGVFISNTAYFKDSSQIPCFNIVLSGATNDIAATASPKFLTVVDFHKRDTDSPPFSQATCTTEQSPTVALTHGHRLPSTC